jgi:hypothetical protein
MTSISMFSIGYLHTVSGSSLAVLLVVQLIKEFPWIRQVPTQILAVIIGEMLFFLTIKPLPASLSGWVVLVLDGQLAGFLSIGSWHVLDGVITEISTRKQKRSRNIILLKMRKNSKSIALYRTMEKLHSEGRKNDRHI